MRTLFFQLRFLEVGLMVPIESFLYNINTLQILHSDYMNSKIDRINKYIEGITITGISQFLLDMNEKSQLSHLGFFYTLFLQLQLNMWYLCYK